MHLMSCSGDIHFVSRKEYGRLGFGKNKEPRSLVQLSMKQFRVKSVAAGGSVLFAVTEDSLAYASCMASYLHHDCGSENEQWVPKILTGKRFKG